MRELRDSKACTLRPENLHSHPQHGSMALQSLQTPSQLATTTCGTREWMWALTPSTPQLPYPMDTSTRKPKTTPGRSAGKKTLSLSLFLHLYLSLSLFSQFIAFPLSLCPSLSFSQFCIMSHDLVIHSIIIIFAHCELRI